MAKFIDVFTTGSSGAPGTVELMNYQVKVPVNRSGGYYSLGIDPGQLPPKFDDSLLSAFERAIEDRFFAAVGGCGLNRQKGPNMQVQKEFFCRQASFADDHRKPLLVNCGKSFADLQDVYLELNPGNPWIIQGFSKNRSLAKKLISSGMFLSFGTDIFYDRNTAEALAMTPFNRLFLETGTQSEYGIDDVYIKTAQIKEVNPERLKEIIARNFEAVFGL